MTRPTRRSDSSSFQYRARTPAPLLATRRGHKLTFHYPDERGGDVERTVTIGPVIKLSLGTSEPDLAKLRTAMLTEQLGRYTRAAAAAPRPLSQRQAVALAGDVYRWIVSQYEDDPGKPGKWMVAAHVLTTSPDEQFSAQIDDLTQRFLDERGIGVAVESKPRLRKAVKDAVRDASALMVKRAGGDYSPDTTAQRFPAWTDKAAGEQATSVTITSLLDGWQAEARRLDRSPSTIDGYGNVLRKFVAFLGHDDAARVTDVDVVRFKDHRLLVEKRDAKTISAGDLVALKSVFKWGVENKRIANNLARDVRLAMPKKAKKRGHTDEAAVQILRASLSYEKRPREHPKTAAAKKWTPLLAALTGARIGELVQLRQEDVRCVDGRWIVRITPEAGTQKGDRERDVPLHPQLIELGFIDFVNGAPDGYLFINATSKADYRGPWQAVKNRVAEFVRQYVPERGVQPNHAMRHRFITLCRRYGVSEEKRRMIVGHKGEGVDELVYGEPAGLYEEIIKLPYYDLS